MRPLPIYFNELSSPCTVPDNTPGAEWQAWATMLFTCVREVSRRKIELDVVFIAGHWHGLAGTKPLSQWIKQWIGNDNFKWLLSRVRNVAASTQDCEVSFENKKADGLTHAHVAGSWAFSFPVPDSPWLAPQVAATEHCLGVDGLDEHQCAIRNLGTSDHVRHWRQELEDWGRVLAGNNVISSISGYPLLMYPNDHGYPHVHLVDPDIIKEGRKGTLAKYRVDVFERMEGPPRWDSEVRPWIERHRADLLSSWDVKEVTQPRSQINPIGILYPAGMTVVH
ncbi:DUF4160 domain-containing protein [bacterium]|nr:DUF4160 domain-containing protein [bacterium]